MTVADDPRSRLPWLWLAAVAIVGSLVLSSLTVPAGSGGTGTTAPSPSAPTGAAAGTRGAVAPAVRAALASPAIRPNGGDPPSYGIDNLTDALAPELLWTGQEATVGDQLVITGGNGLVSVSSSDPGSPQNISGVDAYSDYAQPSGGNLLVGGTGGGCPGGVNLYQLNGSSTSLSSLNAELPASWTTSGSCYDLVAMASGGPYTVLVRETSGGSSPVVGLLDAGVFSTITGRFPTLPAPAAGFFDAAYADGYFLLVAQGYAGLVSPSNNTSRNLSTLLDASYYQTLGSGRLVAADGSSFLLAEEDRVVQLFPNNLTTRPIFNVSSGSATFVSYVGGSPSETWIGVTDDDNTSLYVAYGNGSFTEVGTFWGTLTDLEAFDGAVWASGTEFLNPNPFCHCESVLYAITPNAYPVTFSESGLSPGTLWSVSVGGITENSTGLTVRFNESNGTYAWSASPVPGYQANVSAGTVTVDGASVNATITWSVAPSNVAVDLLGGRTYVAPSLTYAGYLGSTDTSFPTLLTGSSTSRFWSSAAPVLELAASIPAVGHDAGLLLENQATPGSSPLLSAVGTFSPSLSGDGLEAYLFVTPVSTVSWQLPYYATNPEGANGTFLPCQGSVIFPYSSTPYIAVQWDPAYTHSACGGDAAGDFNLYLVTPGAGGVVGRSNIQGLGALGHSFGGAPDAGNYLSFVVRYQIATDSIVANVTDENTSGGNLSYGWFATNLSNYSFSPNYAAQGSYSFGVGGSGNDPTGWGLLYSSLFAEGANVTPAPSPVLNETATLAPQLLWAGAEASVGGALVLPGGNGVAATPETVGGDLGGLRTVVGASTGYWSFADPAGSGVLLGGTGYNCPGGVLFAEYYPSNGTVEDLASELPSWWTASGECHDLASMSSGGGTTLFVEEANGDSAPQVGLLANGTFDNLTSRFPHLAGGWYYSAFGAGGYLLATDGAAYFYGPTNGTVTNLSAKLGGTFGNPPFLGPAYSLVTFTGSAFLVGYSSRVVEFDPANGSAFAPFPTPSGSVTFVSEAGSATWFGVAQGPRTTLYQRNVTGLPIPIATEWGTLSDLVLWGRTLSLVGTDYTDSASLACGCSPVIYEYTPTASIFSVTFVATGLPNGTLWNVSVGGLPTVANVTVGGSGAVSVALPNGTYAFNDSEANASWQTLEQFGNLTVAGAPVTVDLLFEPARAVPVQEAGLAPGRLWDINLTGNVSVNGTASVLPGGVAHAPGSVPPIFSRTTVRVHFLFFSRTTSPVVLLPAGTYQYTAYSSYGVATTTNLTVNISTGAAPTVPVQFTSPRYAATVAEAGLRSGTGWAVEVNGSSYATASTSVTVFLPNGTYPVTVAPVDGYRLTGPVGSLTVQGASEEAVATFAPNSGSLAPVVFRETGLPAGTLWSVEVDGSRIVANTSRLECALAPGAYTYALGAVPGFAPKAPTPLTVGPHGASRTVHFTLERYPVTFTETGLPARHAWKVSAGGKSRSGRTGTLSLDLPNGTYLYSVRPIAGYRGPAASTVTVDGGAVQVALSFVPVLYLVTFTESGLPAGTTWSVTIGTVTHSSGGNPDVLFVLPNGSHPYQIGAVSGYHALGVPRGVHLRGEPLNVTVSFRPTVAPAPTGDVPGPGAAGVAAVERTARPAAPRAPSARATG